MTLVIIFALAGAFMVWERRRPGTPLPQVHGWHVRACLLNVTQLLAVLLAGVSWDRWLGGGSLLGLGDHVGVAAGGVVGYLVSTFVYYWWHRARHASDALWRGLHQVHHSPARLEVLTSFYKHPAEQVVNTVVSAAIVYLLLGLSPAAAAVTTILSATAEFVYHTNVRTPRWMGWFIQRPEMHRIHHARGQHSGNYGDLPLWDMLFGTYRNPANYDGPCGFEERDEEKLGAMLLFRDVTAGARPNQRTWRDHALSLLLVVGISSPVGGMVAMLAPKSGRAIAAPGKALLISPAPKVFCRMGEMEPFAYRHAIDVHHADGTTEHVDVDRGRYRRLTGPYALRNVYGASLAFAPLLRDDTTHSVMHFGICQEGGLLAVADRQQRPRSVVITSSPRQGAMGASHQWEVSCK